MSKDPRIVRTRKSIVDALISLMTKNDIKKITVKDITNKAGINRATFYHHFKDKEALLQYTLDEQIIYYCLEPFNEAEVFSRELVLRVLEAVIELHDYLDRYSQSNFHKFAFSIEHEIKSALVQSFTPLLVQHLNHQSSDFSLVYTNKLVGGLYSSAVAIRRINHQRSMLINYAVDELVK